MYRNFSITHPVYKLLRPHLHYILAINIRALRGSNVNRNLPIGHGADGDRDLFMKACRAFDFDLHWDLPNDIMEREVDELPNYRYRDDAMGIWEGLNVYVANMMNLFYSSDADVFADSELQGWARDSHANGLMMKTRDGTMEKLECNFPPSIGSKEQLVTMLTRIIFCASTLHAAVNFLQFSYMKFSPCYPNTMRGSIPTESDRGNTTMDDILHSLPDHMSSCFNMMFAYVQTRYADNEVYLTDPVPENLFTEPEALEIQENFRQRMLELDGLIAKRNEETKKSGGVPYEVLRPSKVPFGVAI